MSKRSQKLKLWAVVVGTKSKHRRYVAGCPNPRVFRTRDEARTHKYNLGNFNYLHVVKFVEESK